MQVWTAVFLHDLFRLFAVSAYAFLVHQRVFCRVVSVVFAHGNSLHSFRLQGDVAAACGAACFTGITGEKSRAIEILPKGGDRLSPRGRGTFKKSMIFPKLPQVRIITCQFFWRVQFLHFRFEHFESGIKRFWQKSKKMTTSLFLLRNYSATLVLFWNDLFPSISGHIVL